MVDALYEERVVVGVYELRVVEAVLLLRVVVVADWLRDTVPAEAGLACVRTLVLPYVRLVTPAAEERVLVVVVPPLCTCARACALLAPLNARALVIPVLRSVNERPVLRVA